MKKALIKTLQSLISLPFSLFYAISIIRVKNGMFIEYYEARGANWLAAFEPIPTDIISYIKLFIIFAIFYLLCILSRFICMDNRISKFLFVIPFVVVLLTDLWATFMYIYVVGIKWSYIYIETLFISLVAVAFYSITRYAWGKE